MTALSLKQCHGADMRGFRYPMEPLIKRHSFQLERLQVELRLVHVKLRSAQEQQVQSTNLHQQQSIELQRKATVSLNPHHHRISVMYLVKLQSEIIERTKDIESLQNQCAHLKERCLVQQIKIEGLEHDKVDQLKHYALVQNHRLESEADRDWIVRGVVSKYSVDFPIEERK